MATTDMTRVRADLEAERDELRRQRAELEPQSATAPGFDENFADSGQVAAERGENFTLAANLTDQLDDVEAALQRLDDGTYGKCEVCGEQIGEARLEAMPAARFCINHA